jgi:hypothetical protein
MPIITTSTQESNMTKQLKPGLSLHIHISQFTGETIYTICDHVGVVYTTIFQSRLEQFYLEV